MSPFYFNPKRAALAIAYVVFALLAVKYMTGCASIPWRAGVTYHGASLAFDGKRVILDVDGDRMADELRGYAK